jgi:15-cis-phytoene synthase/lycopene beta-cyclase
VEVTHPCSQSFVLKQEKRSLQIFVVPDLPIEEALFFLATNLILVSACFAFDKVVWQRRVEDLRNGDGTNFAPTSPNYFVLNWCTIKQIWHTFAHLDQQGANPPHVWGMGEEQEYSLRILAKASKSFSAAAALLPWDLRMDLGCLYAFARVMDDFIDQPYETSSASSDTFAPSPRIDLLLLFVRITFNEEVEATREVVEEKLEGALHDYVRSGHVLSEEERADLIMSALAASSLRQIVPERLWKELIQGYREDSAPHGPHFKTFQDQADYAQNVAGSIGEMCVRVVLARRGLLISKEYVVPRDISRDTLTTDESETETPLLDTQVRLASHARRPLLNTIEKLLRDARRMGVSLQLVNIARDIVKDAVELKRCYLVTGEQDTRSLRESLCNARHMQRLLTSSSTGSTSRISDAPDGEQKAAITRDDIFAQKLHLLDLAEQIYRKTLPTIELLPCRPASTGLRVACAVYADIGRAIRRDGPEKCLQRSWASNYQRLWVALKTVYWSS